MMYSSLPLSVPVNVNAGVTPDAESHENNEEICGFASIGDAAKYRTYRQRALASHSSRFCALFSSILISLLIEFKEYIKYCTIERLFEFKE